MKLVLFFALGLLMCYIHVTSSVAGESLKESRSINKPTKQKEKSSTKSAGSSTTKTKDKGKPSTKDTSGRTTTKDKSKTSTKDTSGRTTAKDKNKASKKDTDSRTASMKAKRSANIRTPFDKVLDKLSTCASSSPSLVDVMEENLKELQSDQQYTQLFNAAPHTTAFLKKKKKDSNKFITGLRQALGADWSNPAWTSSDEIDTLFRPFKQQFVYALMRFNCT